MRLSKSYLASVLTLAAAGIAGCSDNFDTPPMVIPHTDIEANITIKDLKTQYWNSDRNYIDTIGFAENGDSLYIRARVISSDESGNIYNNLYIQDETGALPLSIRYPDMFNTYRIGQEVVLSVSGMYIGKYNGLQQLGQPEYTEEYGWEATFMSRELFESRVLLNGLPDATQIDTVTVYLDQLTSSTEDLIKYQGQLVRINNVKFEEADGGTLFLDEIGELPLSMQAKLLHAVQDRKIRRVGAAHEIPVNIRIISATNRNLAKLVQQKRFRVDLYYRLNVLSLQIRPLRERHEDLEPLLKLFLNEVQTSFRLSVPAETLGHLLEQAKHWHWPGNVRELRNAVVRSVLAIAQNNTPPRLILDEPNQQLSESLPQDQDTAGSVSETRSLVRDATGQWIDFDTLQRLYFSELLQVCHGRIAGPNGAAHIAGLHPNTMRSRLQKLRVHFSKTS